MKVAARDLEILLDDVAMLTSDRSPYLLDARYGELLDTGENELADALRGIADTIRRFDPDRRHRWAPLQDVIAAMGETDRRRTADYPMQI